MNDSLQFAWPVFLWIGAIVCVGLGALLKRSARRRREDLRKIAHPRLLSQLTASVSQRKRRLKNALWLAAVFLLFVSIARPQLGFEYREVKRRGIDLVFAFDSSRSMLAEDVTPNRLERARLGVIDFVDRLEGDRVALIPFAGNAFALCPLTLDYSAFRQSLEAIDTDIIPHQGTDLASAVREANRLFDEEGNNHRILILITDGEDLQGAVADAIAAAEDSGMIIHTVGVGDPRGTLIPLRQEDGSQDFVRDENGQPVHTALDENTLRKIATATGGIYAPLGRAAEGLDTIYQEKLRLVPKSDLKQRLDRVPLERFEWPLAAALILLVAELLLSERRRQKRNRAPVISAARRKTGPKAASTATTAVMLALSSSLFAQDAATPPDPQASAATADPSALIEENSDPRVTYNNATEDYRNGDYQSAVDGLTRSVQNTTNDLALQQSSYYNLGNSHYRIGEQALASNPGETLKSWQASVKAYEDALALNADDQDAAFNRDLVRRKLEELQQQQQQQQQQNQQAQDDQKKQPDQQNSNGQEPEQDPSDDGQQQDSTPENSASSGDRQSEPEDSQGEQRSESASDHEADSQTENQTAGEQDQKSPAADHRDEPEKQPNDNQSPAASDTKTEETDKPQPGQSRPHPGENSPQSEPTEAPPSPDESQTGQPQDSSGEPSATQPETAAGSFSGERRQPGEMSADEAVRMLQSLEDDERSVVGLPDARTYRRAVPNNTTRGKTW